MGRYRLPPQTSVVDRADALVAWSTGRRVVHLGCVDSPFLEEKYSAGTLLHARLAQVADSLVGVDISRDGLDDLSHLVPGEYVTMDVHDLDADQLPGDTELVVAAEVIEHLASPGKFLDSLAGYLRQSDAEAIITTPNAYYLGGFLRFAAQRTEFVHPDHLVLFSPATLDRIVESAGLRVVERHGHAWRSGTTRLERFRRTAGLAPMRVNPWLVPGLVWRVAPA